MSIVVKERICRQCGVAFQGGPRAWYCPSCRKNRSSEADARHKRNKRAGKTIIIGETIRKCEVCGEPFIMMAARQRYCKQCAPDAIKSVDNDQGREYMAAERANPERNEILKARKRVSSKKITKEISGVKNEHKNTRCPCIGWVADKASRRYARSAVSDDTKLGSRKQESPRVD